MKRLKTLPTRVPIAILLFLLIGCVKSSSQTTMWLSDGTKYVGEVKDGQPNGRGSLIHPNGNMYTGEVRDGFANGEGTAISSNSVVRKAEWRGEWRSGNPYRTTGTVEFVDGTKEIGSWNFDGTKSGGIITWKDGREYKGNWKVVEGALELPDGTGKMTHPDGHVEDGLWKDGKFMGAEKSP